MKIPINAIPVESSDAPVAVIIIPNATECYFRTDWRKTDDFDQAPNRNKN